MTNTLQAFFGANALLGVFSSYLMQYLWGLINALQMIVISALFSLDMPYNARDVMIMILKLVAFEFYDTGEILAYFFDFRETEPFLAGEFDYNGESISRFAEAGYESSNFIELLGLIFIGILISLAILIFIGLLRLIFWRCGANCFTNCIRRKIDYKIVSLRFLLESCIEIGLSAMI